MNLKKATLMGAAILTVGAITTPANAKERISLYEANTFVSKLTNAINNPNPIVSVNFLKDNISNSAKYSTTLNATWYNQNYAYHGWDKHQASSYYQYQPYTFNRYAQPVAYNGAYPYANNGYVHTVNGYAHPVNGYAHPVSYKSISKDVFIDQIERKKAAIPRYHQSVSIIGTRMPADGSKMLLDLEVKEYGLGYSMASYGSQYSHKIQYANSRCQMSISKTNGSLEMTNMTCNTVMNTPVSL